jgi:hypothetical protein
MATSSSRRSFATTKAVEWKTAWADPNADEEPAARIDPHMPAVCPSARRGNVRS